MSDMVSHNIKFKNKICQKLVHLSFSRQFNIVDNYYIHISKSILGKEALVITDTNI